MELQSLCEKVCVLAKEAGLFMKEEKSKISLDIIETKGTHDFVTYVDKTSEKMIVEGLKPLVSGAGFFS